MLHFHRTVLRLTSVVISFFMKINLILDSICFSRIPFIMTCMHLPLKWWHWSTTQTNCQRAEQLDRQIWLFRAPSHRSILPYNVFVDLRKVFTGITPDFQWEPVDAEAQIGRDGPTWPAGGREPRGVPGGLRFRARSQHLYDAFETGHQENWGRQIREAASLPQQSFHVR